VERKRALLVLARVRSFEGTEEWTTVVRRGVAKVIFEEKCCGWEQKGGCEWRKGWEIREGKREREERERKKGASLF